MKTEEIIPSLHTKTGKQKAIFFLSLNLGTLLQAFGIYFFKKPNGFATGGISGLSILIDKVSQGILPQSYTMAVLDVLLLAVGVFVLGRECGFLTCYCTLLLSGFNILFDKLDLLGLLSQGAPALTDEPLLELVYAILLSGIGAAMLFNVGASTGGTDIIAMILKKYTRLNVSTALLLSDFVIAFSTFFIYDARTGLFAMLGLFAKAFVVDDIIENLNMCKAFTIVTSEPDRVKAFIIDELRHSATIEKAVGAYTGENKTVVITVCHPAEAIKLKRKVKEIDPSSFIIITKTSEILGKGFLSE